MDTFQRSPECLIAFLKLKYGYFEDTPFTGCFLPLFFNNPIVLKSCKCQTAEINLGNFLFDYGTVFVIPFLF